jgi:PmbA protein
MISLFAGHRPPVVRCNFKVPDMPSNGFTYTGATLQTLSRDALDYARERGATAAEVEVSEGFGQTVTVRRGEVETIEYNRDKGMGVTVYIGQQRGHASTSDFAPKALRDAVDAALSIARFTAADDCAGLAEPELLARAFPDLQLWHGWPLTVERAIEIATECEDAGFAVDKRISNSEGASVTTQESQFVYGNSHGFLAGYPSSRHSIGCSLIAGANENMQRDDWYDVARASADLASPASIGQRAAERAVRRLDSRKISTTQAPVLFEAPVASSLLGHLVSAVSGGSLYRKSSFLLDSLGKPIFAPLVNISDLPHIPKGLGSGTFDAEGVATQARDVVQAGVLQGYFLGTYSARKLGMRSTGNAGGNHNLILRDTGEDFAALLKKMHRGLLVTELMGQGVNNVTGDYSRGAAGYWVENGEIAYPVQEITIAGNLKEMFMGIVGIGTDTLRRSSRQCGSVLIDKMTIAGD